MHAQTLQIKRIIKLVQTPSARKWTIYILTWDRRGSLTCSTQSQPNKTAAEKPLEFHCFPQSWQQ